jgi:hypothetical protein
VFGNLWIDQLFPVRFEQPQSTFFVGAHQPAVARNVGRHNGGEPAIDALFGHHFSQGLLGARTGAQMR